MEADMVVDGYGGGVLILITAKKEGGGSTDMFCYDCNSPPKLASPRALFTITATPINFVFAHIFHDAPKFIIIFLGSLDSPQQCCHVLTSCPSPSTLKCPRFVFNLHCQSFTTFVTIPVITTIATTVPVTTS
jgi:hypothetical protein